MTEELQPRTYRTRQTAPETGSKRSTRWQQRRSSFSVLTALTAWRRRNIQKELHRKLSMTLRQLHGEEEGAPQRFMKDFLFFLFSKIFKFVPERDHHRSSAGDGDITVKAMNQSRRSKTRRAGRSPSGILSVGELFHWECLQSRRPPPLASLTKLNSALHLSVCF